MMKINRLRQSAANPTNSQPKPEGLTLGTADRSPVIGTYTPPARYRVFHVIRNPAASSLTRNGQLTGAALRLVKG